MLVSFPLNCDSLSFSSFLFERTRFTAPVCTVNQFLTLENAVIYSYFDDAARCTKSCYPGIAVGKGHQGLRSRLLNNTILCRRDP